MTSILETRSERTSNEANVRQMKLPNVRQTKLANVHQILYFKGYLNDKVRLQFAQRLIDRLFGKVPCILDSVDKQSIIKVAVNWIIEAQIEHDLASRVNECVRGLGQQKYFRVAVNIVC